MSRAKLQYSCAAIDVLDSITHERGMVDMEHNSFMSVGWISMPRKALKRFSGI